MARAEWSGTLKEGTGNFSTESGAIQQAPYSFGKRFLDEAGSNPEELIAAALASCFSMALSANLEKAGLSGIQVHTEVWITFEPANGVPTLTEAHLRVKASGDGLTNEQLSEIAADTSQTCPISRALSMPKTVETELG